MISFRAFQNPTCLEFGQRGEGRPEQAFQELVQLQKEFPNHPQLLRQLVEMAWDLGKIEESQRWEEKLRQREGPDGFYWRYYRARRLLAEIQDIKDKRFHEAEKLVDELLTLRPSWPGTHLLRAQIEQKRGNQEQAIDAYSNAIRLGERRIEVYEQLTELLYAERRFAEAEEYLSQLQEQVPLSENLSTLEISLAAQAGRLDRALAAARRGVKSRPKDPMAQIWLAQVLLANRQSQRSGTSVSAGGANGPGRRSDAQRPVHLLSPHPPTGSRRKNPRRTR